MGFLERYVLGVTRLDLIRNCFDFFLRRSMQEQIVVEQQDGVAGNTDGAIARTWRGTTQAGRHVQVHAAWAAGRRYRSASDH